MPKSERSCERCPSPTVKPDERFCKECRKRVLEQLEDAGYFTQLSVPHYSEQRGRKAIRSSDWFSHQIREDDYSEESVA